MLCIFTFFYYALLCFFSPFPTVAEAIQEELEQYKSSEEEVKRLKASMVSINIKNLMFGFCWYFFKVMSVFLLGQARDIMVFFLICGNLYARSDCNQGQLKLTCHPGKTSTLVPCREKLTQTNIKCVCLK